MYAHQSKLIHPDTLEDIKQRTDIIDIIAGYVTLKKRGKDYVGLCPFHKEKTPSFSVSPLLWLQCWRRCNQVPDGT